jgi:hypothetical protein
MFFVFTGGWQAADMHEFSSFLRVCWWVEQAADMHEFSSFSSRLLVGGAGS